jgi:hypothetical protein
MMSAMRRRGRKRARRSEQGNERSPSLDGESFFMAKTSSRRAGFHANASGAGDR